MQLIPTTISPMQQPQSRLRMDYAQAMEKTTGRVVIAMNNIKTAHNPKSKRHKKTMKVCQVTYIINNIEPVIPSCEKPKRLKLHSQ